MSLTPDASNFLHDVTDTSELRALPWRPTNNLKAALDYASIGWRVFPVHSIRNGLCTCDDRKCKAPGKHPITPRGHKDATTDPARIKEWWSSWPKANIGAYCSGSGMVVFDVDPRNGGDANLAAWEREHGELAPSVISNTGGGGRHLVFAAPQGVTLPGTLVKGVDIKSEGYILLPPSSHKSGNAYAWAPGRDPFQPDTQALGLDDLPPQALRHKSATPSTQGERIATAPLDDLDFADLTDAVRAIPNDDDAGLDRDEWLKIGAAIHHQANGAAIGLALFDEWSQEHASYDAEATRKAWESFGKRRNGPLITARTILLKAREGGWRHAHEVGDRLTGDLTLARQFAREHAFEFRYVAEAKTWLHWDGSRWGAHLAAEKVVTALHRMLGRNLNDASAAHLRARAAHEARGEANEEDGGREDAASTTLSLDEAKRAFDKAHAYYNDARKSRAVQSLLPAQLRLLTSANDWDRDAMLLGVHNGVLDLRSGELLAPDPARRISKRAGCAFDPKARCPKFDGFLQRIMPDAATRDFLRRAIGYTLTGSVDEEKLFFAHGVGRNGKSVLANILAALMGEYAVTLGADLLLATGQGKGEGARSVARLPGARLALLNETPVGTLWDDSAVKVLASRESIQARALYREAFDFFPTHKLWVRGNHLPGARDASDGFWRRMVAVKFGEQIAPEEVVSNLDRQIIDEELPGVLNWALRGCLDWQASGLKVPAAVTAEIADYRAETDTLGQWLAERTERERGAQLPAKAAFASYRLFCDGRGVRPGSEHAFGRALRERGFASYRTRRERGYEGLTLLEPTQAFEAVSDE